MPSNARLVDQNAAPLTPAEVQWVLSNARQLLGLVPRRVKLLALVLEQSRPFSLYDIAKKTNMTAIGVRDALVTLQARGLLIIDRERQGGPRPDLFCAGPGPRLRPLLNQLASS